MKQNLHTHSHYDDGRDSIRDMCESAVNHGFQILGFSGHSPLDLDDSSMSLQGYEQYKADVLQAREIYKDQLQIYLGLELDSLSQTDTAGLDYVIGSVHFLKADGRYIPVDYSKKIFDELADTLGGIQPLVQAYCASLIEMMNARSFDILGHLDLIAKYNEGNQYFDPEERWFAQAYEPVLQKIKEKGIIAEMNTGAMARGYRSEPYPCFPLLKRMSELQIPICINTDCHNRENLDLGMETAAALAQKAGYTSFMQKTAEGFIPVPLAKS